VISTWRKYIYKNRWLAQSYGGDRLVKFIFGVTVMKTWNAPWIRGGSLYFLIAALWDCLYLWVVILADW